MEIFTADRNHVIYITDSMQIGEILNALEKALVLRARGKTLYFVSDGGRTAECEKLTIDLKAVGKPVPVPPTTVCITSNKVELWS